MSDFPFPPVTALCIALILAACQAPKQLSQDSRVAVDPAAGVFVANPLAISVAQTGITVVSLELRNSTRHDVAVTCTTDWFNAAGQPAGGLSAMPSRISVGANTSDFCRTVAPNPEATSFRIAVAPVD